MVELRGQDLKDLSTFPRRGMLSSGKPLLRNVERSEVERLRVRLCPQVPQREQQQPCKGAKVAIQTPLSPYL